MWSTLQFCQYDYPFAIRDWTARIWAFQHQLLHHTLHWIDILLGLEHFCKNFSYPCKLSYIAGNSRTSLRWKSHSGAFSPQASLWHLTRVLNKAKFFLPSLCYTLKDCSSRYSPTLTRIWHIDLISRRAYIRSSHTDPLDLISVRRLAGTSDIRVHDAWSGESRRRHKWHIWFQKSSFQNRGCWSSSLAAQYVWKGLKMDLSR